MMFSIFDDLFGIPPRRQSNTITVQPLRCRWTDFLQIHNDECSQAVAERWRFRILVKQLHNRILDDRNLFATWMAFAELERTHPGSTPFAAVARMSRTEIWKAVKLIRRVLRNPNFQPCASDLDAWSTMLSVGDLVIREAAYRILGPALEPKFDRMTIPCHREDDCLRGLKRTLKLSVTKRRFVWITVEICEPFNCINRERLLDIFWDELPHVKLFRLIETQIQTPSGKGIPGRGRLDVLLAELYLDRLVMREWRKKHPQVPMLRSRGAFLILCRARTNAQQPYRNLKKILHEAGMRIDKSKGAAIRGLGAGQSSSWLGFDVSRRAGEWQYERTFRMRQ